MNQERIAITGGMTMTTARELLQRGAQALATGNPEFDLSGVGETDSAGLAVLFGWQRAAQAQGKPLRVTNIPASLISLAEVYGVTDLLPR